MNAQQFQKNMKAAAQEISVSSELLTKIALIVEAEAKRNAPVRTGTLRRSITHRIEGHAAYVGTAVTYAVYVEAKQPFLSTALETQQGQIESIVKAYGGKVLDKVSK